MRSGKKQEKKEIHLRFVAYLAGQRENYKEMILEMTAN